MASFHLLKSEVADLTPELAAEFRDLDPSPTEREFNPTRVAYLREKAEKNWLVTFHWAKARMGNKWLRMNGQHSSRMLCELNGAFPANLKVHLDQYEVDGPDGLALLFRQFDDRKSGRSAADVAGAYQNIEPALQQVPRPIGKLAVDGIAWYRRKVEKAPVPQGDGQYTLFHEFVLHDFIRWMGDLFSIKTPELKKDAVVGAIYACFSANEGETRKFWEEVARGGDQYSENAATTVLDAWLKEIKENHKKDPLTPAQVYQGCIYAYNAHRKGQVLKSIKYDFKEFPEPMGFAA